MFSQAQKNKAVMTVRTLAYCAMLAALSVVLSRLIIPMPNEFTRFSIGMVPVFMAGLLFGSMPGALVGFAADLVGCLFSGYGYNPIFCISPILYGVFAGILRLMLANRYSSKKLVVGVCLGYFAAMVLGSVLYMSAAMAFTYAGEGAFKAFFMSQLLSRTIQYAITLPVDAVLTILLFNTRIFDRMGIWPPKSNKKDT